MEHRLKKSLHVHHENDRNRIIINSRFSFKFRQQSARFFFTRNFVLGLCDCCAEPGGWELCCKTCWCSCWTKKSKNLNQNILISTKSIICVFKTIKIAPISIIIINLFFQNLWLQTFCIKFFKVLCLLIHNNGLIRGIEIVGGSGLWFPS